MDSEVIPILGYPNAGKTTVFSWLTETHQKIVNYPGSTVECAFGKSSSRWGDPLYFLDTPGTYSVDARTPEEVVTVNCLFTAHLYPPGLVLVLVDATRLSRDLLLVAEVKAAGFSPVVGVTHIDEVRKSGLELDCDFLSDQFQASFIPIEAQLGGGIFELKAKLDEQLKNPIPQLSASNIKPPGWDFVTKTRVLQQCEVWANQALRRVERVPAHTAVDAGHEVDGFRLDSWLFHQMWGPVIFLAVMVAIFGCIFWLAAPVMDWVDDGFVAFAELLKQQLAPSWALELVTDAIIPGLGAALVFVPQIWLLFVLLGFVEQSGYLARAATWADPLFKSVGMSGRSFVPLMAGFACAVPALMATRSISGRRERRLTQFIIPLMTCSARLPVYALLLAVVFQGRPSWQPALALAALYLVGWLLGLAVAAVISRLPRRSHEPGWLMLEIPRMRWPSFKSCVTNANQKTLSYIRRAGPIIVVLSILLWTLSQFPRDQQGEAPVLATSYLGQMGQWAEPAFEPMGADWRVGVALLSAFAAREVFVSTLGVVLAMGAPDASDVKDHTDDAMADSGLMSQMAYAKKSNGEDLFSMASVLALIVFFVLALQCISTSAVAFQETQSWRWTLLPLLGYNLAAYVAAVVTYQLIIGLQSLHLGL